MSSTAALKSHWRKVSSTDNLQAFDTIDDTAEDHSLPKLRQAVTGILMIALAIGLLVAELAVLVIKAQPQLDWPMMQAVYQDKYYVYLLPLMTPMLLIAVTTNWFSLKLFKHNS